MVKKEHQKTNRQPRHHRTNVLTRSHFSNREGNKITDLSLVPNLLV